MAASWCRSSILRDAALRAAPQDEAGMKERTTMSEYDVIVVGAGNAAFCAVLAAQEQGASVLMLEAAPEQESGGNSRFTAGSIRVVYNGVDDIKTLVPDLTEA